MILPWTTPVVAREHPVRSPILNQISAIDAHFDAKDRCKNSWNASPLVYEEIRIAFEDVAASGLARTGLRTCLGALRGAAG